MNIPTISKGLIRNAGKKKLQTISLLFLVMQFAGYAGQDTTVYCEWGQFEIVFPGVPVECEVDSSSKLMKMTYSFEDHRMLEYVVTFAERSDSMLPEDLIDGEKMLLQYWTLAEVDTVTTVDSTDATYGRFTGITDSEKYMVMIVISRSRHYRLIVSGPPSTNFEAEAHRFFESFVIK